MSSPGLVVVIAAPSGAGKLTLLNKVRENLPSLVSTVSATTRPPRPGEEDGRDYWFLAREDFERRLDADEFVEWAEVHGNLYGTLKSEVARLRKTGSDVVLELDVQGHRSIRSLFDDVVSVFLMPPSLEELERRLRTRGANDDDDLALRLRNASDEMAARFEFDYIVVNDDLARAADDMCAILRAERLRAFRQAGKEQTTKETV